MPTLYLLREKMGNPLRKKTIIKLANDLIANTVYLAKIKDCRALQKLQSTYNFVTPCIKVLCPALLNKSQDLGQQSKTAKRTHGLSTKMFMKQW
jgi:hypothetical protein